MNIGEVLNKVYDDEVGWRPASGGIKPVHVANGLVRAVSGRVFDTSGVNQMIVWWRKGKILDDDRRLEALLQGEHADALRAFESQPHQFDRARRYLYGLLGADKAVYPSAEQSDLSLTCAEMASRSPNDRGLGEFANALLDAADGSKALLEAIREALSVGAPKDPVTIAAWPLLDAAGTPRRATERSVKALRRPHARAAVQQLQDAAASLATHERAQGNRLRTLQRAVHFVCAATHAHAQALAAGGDLDRRPPALVAVMGARQSEVALASERSLDHLYDRFEDWLADQLAARIAKGTPLSDEATLEGGVPEDKRGARAVLARIGVAAKGHAEPEKEILDARLNDYDEARRRVGKDEPARCLAYALVAAYTREYESGGPRNFLQALGRKSGLLYPHFQGGGAREKRVRPSVPVLDMMVRACVPAGDLVPLDEFLAALWARFGLIVGGRRTDDWDDGAVLEESGIALDASVLMTNTEEIVEQLVTMGLARRYPDNVTFIGDINV